jgi:hypothetical protein
MQTVTTLQNRVASTNANRIGTEILAKVAVHSCFARAPDAYTPAIQVLTRRLHGNESIKYPAKKTRRQARTGYLMQLI